MPSFLSYFPPIRDVGGVNIIARGNLSAGVFNEKIRAEKDTTEQTVGAGAGGRK